MSNINFQRRIESMEKRSLKNTFLLHKEAVKDSSYLAVFIATAACMGLHVVGSLVLISAQMQSIALESVGLKGPKIERSAFGESALSFVSNFDYFGFLVSFLLVGTAAMVGAFYMGSKITDLQESRKGRDLLKASDV